MPKQQHISNTLEAIDTIENNTRIIESLSWLVMGFDYGCYDDNTIPDCMFVISNLANEARQASEVIHREIHHPSPEITEG